MIAAILIVAGCWVAACLHFRRKFGQHRCDQQRRL
jgi:hypothetical protein